MTPDGRPVGRRAFLWTAALGGIAALLGEWLPRWWVTAAAITAPFRIPDAAQLAVGSALSFTVPGTTAPAILVRRAADEFVAFDQRCPHLGCPVQWSPQRGRFECPCHQAVFDGVLGGVVSGPPRRGLRRIAVEQRGDEVWALHAARDGEAERSL